MSKRNSKFQVLPLKVLASARVSLNRAKDIDFNFMELIANGVEEPEYNVTTQRLLVKLVKS